MSKTRIFSIVAIVFIALALIFNPSKSTIKDHIRDKMGQAIEKQMQKREPRFGSAAMSFLGPP